MNGLTLNTFSITAKCRHTGMFGVAVSTARPAVGGLVPYAKAGVGAIATQALVNPFVGIDGMRHLSAGLSAAEVKERLLGEDDPEHVERRQFAIVDAAGRTAGYTGGDTVPWAGHKAGDGFVVAGNMLVGAETIEAMAESFAGSGERPLAERLLDALACGQRAGGDKRGKQSAALYVVHEEEYPLVDIRVDEHAAPVDELKRVYEVCQTDLFPYMAKAPRRAKRKAGGDAG
ncbi:MAG TPA: DUF1028 domain-containing protein [Bacillales bacterium]|nr:DUF1028 domain-containing protein [Bacillales bacterium]